MAMGGDVKAERTQQVNKAIDEATQIFTKLRDAGAISQEEMNQYVKSFAPQEPAKSAKDLVDSVVSGISSVASRLAHGVVTIGQAIGEQQVSQSVKDLLSAPAADCKAVDEAMSKAANDNNVTAETLIGATVKACSTEQAQQTKGAAGIDQNTLQEAQQTKGAAGIDQNTLQEAAAGLASAVNEAGQISSLNQAETQIAQGQQQQSGGWSRGLVAISSSANSAVSSAVKSHVPRRYHCESESHTARASSKTDAAGREALCAAAARLDEWVNTFFASVDDINCSIAPSTYIRPMSGCLGVYVQGATRGGPAV
ncbi:hypothetical protein GH714_042507 [Hevea brasiliensis]|uniref:Uncharacterized protein n=1 Tax=Hevea brasiliensis TaxID=3981 RepID=A0A6A6K017_HEVBR|nr:hypothetical protein GH714_042507 [Hevea brasiliensis]